MAKKDKSLEAEDTEFVGAEDTESLNPNRKRKPVSLKNIVGEVKQYKVYAFLAPLIIVFEVFMEVYIPLMVMRIVDEGIPSGDTKQIFILAGITVLMALASIITGVLAGIFASKAGTGLAANLRNSQFKIIQKFSFYNIDKFETGSLITRLTTDVQYIQMAFMMLLRMAVRAPIMLIMSLTFAISINWQLALIFLVGLPVILVGIIFLARFAFPMFFKMFKAFDKMNTRVEENLAAIRVVKSFVREGYETQEFRDSSERVFKIHRKAERLMSTVMPLFSMIIYATLALVLWFGGNKVITTEMTDGELMTFLQYVTMILFSVVGLAMVLVQIIMSRASAERITEVLKESSDITDGDAAETEIADGSIKFDNVSFAYKTGNPDMPVLRNINLEINSGETVGIIGATGSSKTTLVSLIARLYDTTAGEVFVGGKRVTDYKLKALRDGVGVVLQKNVLFKGTIAENLRWGKPDATDEEIKSAAKFACADTFIESFPDGYNSAVQQGGSNLSGGQKQRLCIARTLLKSPKIIIFDDSTSAVDMATDAYIRNEIKKNLSDMTVIVIAQRMSSVMDSDKIIVLNNGEVEAVGTHDELLAQDGTYKAIYSEQYQSYAEQG
ncbi:MAG: ABC transporter ATP-binding protein/permease [Christensenellaceae bacterium]|jgi:ATP-binding cassette subfamily B protein|nr:ABC transporter ATP-binding protein/permease [Christensenellaceae bacterium]